MAGLFVYFARPLGESVAKGPFARLTFTGARLFGDDLTVPLAVHEDNSWMTKEGKFSRLDVDGPVTVTLVRPTISYLVYGPYAAFSCVNGIAYVDGAVFALEDEPLDDWYSLKDDSHWKSIQVAPA